MVDMRNIKIAMHYLDKLQAVNKDRSSIRSVEYLKGILDSLENSEWRLVDYLQDLQLSIKGQITDLQALNDKLSEQILHEQLSKETK